MFMTPAGNASSAPLMALRRGRSTALALSHGDANQSYEELDFAFYLGPNGYLYVCENNVPVNFAGFYASWSSAIYILTRASKCKRAALNEQLFCMS